jgi:hypothetical protein
MSILRFIVYWVDRNFIKYPSPWVSIGAWLFPMIVAMLVMCVKAVCYMVYESDINVTILWYSVAIWYSILILKYICIAVFKLVCYFKEEYREWRELPFTVLKK